MAWRHTVKIKHLLLNDVKDPTDAQVQDSMNKIADVLQASGVFVTFGYLAKFRSIPAGDDVIGSLEYADTLLDLMYDYADRNRIWIG